MRVRKRLILEEQDRNELLQLVRSGHHSAYAMRHANILLDLDENQKARYTQQEIAERNHVCIATVAEISKRFLSGGIEQAMHRKHRETPPVASKFTGEVEARIVKLACSQAPQGRKRWTLQLLADEAVRLKIVDSVSDNGIRLLLKKRNLSLI